MNTGNDNDAVVSVHADDDDSGDDHTRIERSADDSTITNDKGEEEVMKQRMDALQYVVDGIEVSESDIITESARTSS